MNNYTITKQDNQQVEAYEKELIELITKVMKVPLEPLEKKIQKIDERLQSVENHCKETNETFLPGVQSQVKQTGEDVKKSVRTLGQVQQEHATDLSEVKEGVAQLHTGQQSVKELLGQVQQEHTTDLSKVKEGVAQLHTGQQSVKDLLGQVQQKQTVQTQSLDETLKELNTVGHYTKIAADESSKAVVCIAESREYVGQALNNIQAEARNEVEQQGVRAISLEKEQRHTTVQLEAIILSLERKLTDLGIGFEKSLLALQDQSDKNRTNELAQLKKDMQQRLMWLFGISGLSLAGAAWPIVKSFL